MTSGQEKSTLLKILGAATLVAVLCGSYWGLHGRFIEETDNAYVEAEMAVLSSRVAGYVAAVYVAENQPVSAGQALLKIDDSDYQAKFNKAEAQVAMKQAELKSLTSELRLQVSVIAAVSAELATAEADRQLAVSDQKRFAELVKTGSASRQQLDQANVKAETAKAAYRAAQANVRAEQDRQLLIEDRRLELQAGLAEAEAEAALAKIDLDNTVVRAPMDGVIGNKRLQVGQYLQPGLQVITVVPLAEVYVAANFKETQIERLQIGQPVSLKVDAFAGESITGVVESLSPAAGSRFSLLPPENATGNFTKIVQRIPVRIRVESQAAGHLRPGMSVVVSVDTRAEADQALARQFEPPTVVNTVMPRSVTSSILALEPASSSVTELSF